MNERTGSVASSPIPGISVVIPTYRHEKTIGQTLDSLLAQTLEPREIIVINDGSPDDTDAAIERYRGRITYIKQANGGASAAANRGFALCTQELVMFIASDDWLMPNALETLATALASHPDAGVAYGEVTVVDGEGNPKDEDFTGIERRRVGKHDGLPLLVRGNFVPAPATLFRASAFRDAGPFLEFPHSQDWALLISVALNGWYFVGCPARIACYRENLVRLSNRLAIAEDVLDMFRFFAGRPDLTEEQQRQLRFAAISAERGIAWADLLQGERTSAGKVFARHVQRRHETAKSLAGLAHTVLPLGAVALTQDTKVRVRKLRSGRAS